MRELLLDFSALYPQVRSTQKFGVHDELWGILGRLTNQIHDLIQDIPGSAKIKIGWSLGKGVWVNVPWLALMHEDETDTTQKGLYCCYLFSEDMSTISLTLSIGATEYLNKHTPKKAHEEMAQVCDQYSDYFTDLEKIGFGSADQMDLSSGKLGKSYEHGVVTFKKYQTSDLPSEEILKNDLHQLVEKYIDFINYHDKSSHQKSEVSQRVWSLSLGYRGEYFEEFYSLNKIAIGWDAIGDFRQYPTREDFLSIIKKSYPEKSDFPRNDARACMDFAYKMKPGDLVFIKRGTRHVIAYGIVDGEYTYEEGRPYFKNTRKIIWQGKGEWEISDKFANKTLTDITGYTKFVEDIKATLGMKHVKAQQAVSSPFSIDDALQGIFLPRGDFEKALKVWKAKKNLILQGPPGVGKSFIAENLSYALMGKKNKDALKRVQFHQSYSYEDFIQGYRPTDSGFVLKDGVFVKFCQQAISDPDNTYVFIIDEINRGNLSKILGELMVLIEGDKRGPRWSMPLTYNDEPFYVPENLFLLGMMNTADRSLSLVDYALRRRFSFLDIGPQFHSPRYKEYLMDKGADTGLIDMIIERIGKLNTAIMADTVSLGEGFCIGHSYFCPSGGVRLNQEWYKDQIETEIIPLLKEYWFDNRKKVDDCRTELLENIA